MKLEYYNQQTGGKLMVGNAPAMLRFSGIDHNRTTNTIVFNFQDDQMLLLDEVPYHFPKNTALALMANQSFRFEHPEQLLCWQFNREFYCIVDHDAEVGCAGFLFYGICNPFFIQLSQQDINHFEQLYNFCQLDMKVRDRMQNEMLRTLLKRVIISTTRLARLQSHTGQPNSDDRYDLLRSFNLLLEGNFRREHEVKFYANMLNKSPKTLSNLFALLGVPSPSKLIQNRLILEAKRYLNYTDKSAKEIAYQLGFISPAHFSRFFKLYSGESISAFRAENE